MKTIAEQLNVTEFPFRIWDSKKRLIYFEESDKRWAKYEHDSEGNVIYFEGSNGYWSKKEYDANGNEIHFEDSRRYWWKREYDANGNEIYYENSRGEIEDKRPKSCEDKVVEIDGVININ